MSRLYRHRRHRRYSPTVIPGRAVHDSRLGAKLHFAPADLITNRAGYLSSEQRARLGRLRWTGRTRVHVLLAAVGLGLAGVLWQARQPDGITLAAGIVGSWSLGRAGWWWRQIGLDLRHNRVQTVAGQIAAQDGPHITIGQQVRQRRLRLPTGGQAPFNAGAHYRLYYAPHSRVVVSAAPLAR